MTTITREQLIKRAQARLELMQEAAQEFSESPNAQMDFRLAEIALASLDAGSDSNSHPAHGPLSNDRLHRISDILRKAAAQSDGGNIGYAMSDAVKAIDELLEVRKAEPVADVVAWASPNEERKCDIRWRRHDVAPGPLYTAPPAPVPMKYHQIRKLVNELRDIAVEYHGTQQLRERIARTIRAAMLNGGKS